jgi:hypothetical protein
MTAATIASGSAAGCPVRVSPCMPAPSNAGMLFARGAPCDPDESFIDTLAAQYG